MLDDDHRVLGPGFHERVFALVCEVPAGRVTTYGDVARTLGAVEVARHVGFALAALRDDSVPWHRVINSRGRISFPVGSAQWRRQQALLEAEGVHVSDEGRVDLRRLAWTFAPR
jgi:methylated-DNA-protein-cysteine methyltransferase-like protein